MPGRPIFGTANGMGCRHSDETVALVRSVYKPREFGYDQIAKLTGISRWTVRHWCTQKNRRFA